MSEQQILIIDDEPELSAMVARRLKRSGYIVREVYDGAQGRQAVEEGFDGVILLDLRLPDADGMELLAPLSAPNPQNRIIVMTAYGSSGVAEEATRRGAYAFVTKGDDLHNQLSVQVKNAFQDRAQASRIHSYEQQFATRAGFGNIVARSPQMLSLFARLKLVIDSKVSVLIEGESGTGKELVARALHFQSARRAGPFVALNCAGIPDTLLESELFGHERGAFTGAIQKKKGKFELADGGTIFLDEIGEMPFHLQAKILRVVQDRVVERVGGTVPRKVDVRIISATHRNLTERVAGGQFREDLYYRLAVFPVPLPPLRERSGDIGLLAQHFLQKSCADERKPLMALSSATMGVLERYPFPGNVRELENIVSHAVVVGSGDLVKVRDLPLNVVEAVRKLPAAASTVAWGAAGTVTLEGAMALLFPTLEDMPDVALVEGALIERAMLLSDGNVDHAAEAIGLSRATFYRRLKAAKKKG